MSCCPCHVTHKHPASGNEVTQCHAPLERRSAMRYEEGKYFAPQKPHCQHIIAPARYLVKEDNVGSGFFKAGEWLSAIFKRFNQCVLESRRVYGLEVKVTDCRRREADKVEAKPGLTWKIEVSYPRGHPKHSQGIPPSDDEVTSVAKLALPSHPQCHTVLTHVIN